MNPDKLQEDISKRTPHTLHPHTYTHRHAYTIYSASSRKSLNKKRKSKRTNETRHFSPPLFPPTHRIPLPHIRILSLQRHLPPLRPACFPTPPDTHTRHNHSTNRHRHCQQICIPITLLTQQANAVLALHAIQHRTIPHIADIPTDYRANCKSSPISAHSIDPKSFRDDGGSDAEQRAI